MRIIDHLLAFCFMLALTSNFAALLYSSFSLFILGYPASLVPLRAIIANYCIGGVVGHTIG